MRDDLPDETDWPELMARAQDGDGRAYGLVLRAMVPAIRAYARRRIYDDSLVEDAVQDVLLTVHRLRHTYDPARPLRPWLAAISTARAIDLLRRTGRSRRAEVRDDAALAEAVDAGSAIEAGTAKRELGRLLDALPPRQRTIVEMVKLDEMTLDDAARANRMSVSAVKSLLHRAVARLREHGKRDDEQA